MAKKQNQQNISKPVSAVKAAPAKPASESKGGMSLVIKLSLLLGAIAFLLYCNTLGNKYVLDDFTVIKNNRIVTQGFSALGEIFATPYRRGWFETHNDLYRPLSLAMFAMEWELGSHGPWLSHFMNVLIFAGAVIFLFLSLDKLFDGRRTGVAFIAALLFALHPIHTEVVANIKSRDELLCFFFAFLSLSIFLDYVKSGKMQHLVLGGLCFFLSFLSKETVISFIAVIPFIFFFYRNEDTKKSALITAVTLVVTAMFLVIRFVVLRKYDANTSSEVVFMDNILAKPPSALAAFATELLILGKYIKLLVVPYPLVCDYSYNAIAFTSMADPMVILSLLFYIAIGIYGIYRLIKFPKDPYAFAILFFLATIALFSNIPFIIGAAMAERFVFFASVGFCLAVALLLQHFLSREVSDTALLKNTKVLTIVAIVGGIWAVITFNRNEDWFDNPTLFRTDVAHSPNDSRLNYYLGTELVTETAQHEGNPAVKAQIITEGTQFLRKALEVNPSYDDAHAALGDAFFKLQRYDSAELHDKKALELNPKFLVAMNNLAGVYFMYGRYDLSLGYCRMAINQAPNFVDAYSNMGLCFYRMKQYDSSLHYLYKAIQVNPKYRSSYENIVFTFNAIQKPDSARKYKAILDDLMSGN